MIENRKILNTSELDGFDKVIVIVLGLTMLQIINTNSKYEGFIVLHTPLSINIKLSKNILELVIYLVK